MSKHELKPRLRSSSSPRARREFVRKTTTIFAIAVACLSAAPQARADVCSLAAGIVADWTAAPWTCDGGSAYPGQHGNDTATITDSTVNVTSAIPFGVILNMAGVAGTLNIDGGSMTLLAPMSVLAGNSININSGTLVVGAGPVWMPDGLIRLNGGTLRLNAGLDIRFPASFEFAGGTLAGTGAHDGTSTLTLMDGNTIFMSGGVAINGAIIDSLGVLECAANSVLMTNGHINLVYVPGAGQPGELRLAGSNTIAGAGSSIEVYNGAVLSIGGQPMGLMGSRSATSRRGRVLAGSAAIQVPVNNQGSVSALGAQLQLLGGGNHFGVFTAGIGGAILFSGTHSFGGGSQFNAAPSLASYWFDGPGSRFNINTSLQIPGLNWTGGTIGTTAGPQTLGLSNANIFDGSLAIGSGTTVQLPAGTLTLSSTANIAGPGRLELDGGASVSIEGSPNVIGAPVTLSSPTLTFLDSIRQITFSGGGTIIGGTFNTPALTNTFEFSGPFDVRAGTFTGPGCIRIGSPAGTPATFTISGSNAPVSFAGTTGQSRLFNYGTIVFRPPQMSVDVSGYQIRNDGTIDLQNDTSLTMAGAATTITNNGGLFLKSAGTPPNRSTIEPPFTTSGTVRTNAGILDFLNGYTQAGGNTILGGGTLAVVGGTGTLNLNSGQLNGSGTINASLANNLGAIVWPGLQSPASAGLITVTGNYVQNGALQMKLGGTTRGSGYDALSVGGTATINGGGLGITYIPPFTSPNAQVYDLITSTGARSGSFGVIYFPDPAAAWSATYTANAVQAVIAQADVGVTQSAATFVPHGQDIVYTISVTNYDTVTATNLSIDNTFTAPATFKAATGSLCSNVGQSVTCSLSSLAPGATYSMTLTLTNAAVGSVFNTATVTSQPFDPVVLNNSVTREVIVKSSADLSIAITPPASVIAGQTGTFTVAIANAGLDPAAAYSASFVISGGTLVSVTGMACTATSTTTADCTQTLPLANGETNSVSVVAAAANTGGTMSLSGTVASASDTSPGNNGPVSASVVVNPAADVSATHSGPASVVHGNTATITVVISNAGPSTATNVMLTDTLSNATLVSATPTQGSCSGTGSAISCTIGTLAPGSAATLSLVVTATTMPQLTNHAVVSAAELDPLPANNTAQPDPLAISVTSAADLAVRLSALPNPIEAGRNTTLTATVRNLGPSTATAVVLKQSFNGGTLVSVVPSQGSCGTTVPIACSIGTLADGASATVTLLLRAGSADIADTALVSAAEYDPNSANNSATLNISTTPLVDFWVTKSGPASAAPASKVTYTITVGNNGPSTGTAIELTDPTPAGLVAGEITGACSSLPCTLPSLASQATATISASFTVAGGGTAPAQITNTASVKADNDSNPANDSASVTTSIVCPTQPPTAVSPLTGTVNSPVTFRWTAVANATVYEVFLTQKATVSVGTTSGTSLTASVPETGPFSWYVVATTSDCGTLPSSAVSLTACNAPEAPVISVVANAASGQIYSVEWRDVPGANRYEIQEADNSDFSAPLTQTITTTAVTFSHSSTTVMQGYFYRVRALAACDPAQASAWSSTGRVVIAPVPRQNVNPNANVPAGSKLVVVQDVPIAGIADNNIYTFAATVDKPWLSVSPSSGVLPSTGIVLQITADPSSLSNGTFTGTLVVTITPLATASNARPAAVTTTTVSVPVSISLVTPVMPSSSMTTPANALVIPSVGHLDGINSHWRSDVRVANPGFSRESFTLSFTPSSADTSVVTKGTKQTTVMIDAGQTVALDDIARNWFGVGSLGEAANGVLMIRPLGEEHSKDAAAAAPSASSVVASSRTYSVSAAGTLGQYIPAVPFSSFIGAAAAGEQPSILSLQHIAQSKEFRTNVGIVEAAGSAAEITLTVFDTAGRSVREIPITIYPFQQLQLNSFLASQQIAIDDGRIEIKVTGGSGKVTGYASVVDNLTGDPLLVSGVPVSQTSATRYVLPGVADFDTGQASWRSDVRIFNGGTSPHQATLALHPLGGGTPLTTTVTLDPGEVELIDDAVTSLFGVSNLGGALHVTTSTDSSLVVTGRTYNAVAAGGTYGQFIPAVTAGDSVGSGGRTLHLLQVEESPRYRTNVGIAELSGEPATAEITVYLPDSKVAPRIEIPLAAYEYRQFPVIQQLGLGNVYNARLSISVKEGNGRITAYASVIDQITQDPTYVPAQQ